MRYLAIDFETANARRSSICAFGYALFEDHQLLDTASFLCKPYPNDYDDRNVQIHGISSQDTDGLPGFERHFELLSRFAPDFLVAHNASFEASCIRSWCETQGYPVDLLPFVCTLKISRNIHPGMTHKLSSLCRLYSIPLVHHDAGSDALACGMLLQRLAADFDPSGDIALLRDQFGQDCPKAAKSKASFAIERSGYRADRIRPSQVFADALDALDEQSPLHGQHICMTGALDFASRSGAAKLAANRGAINQDTVSRKTNILVIGPDEYARYWQGHKTNKIQKAERYIEQGQVIELLDEQGFWRRLGIDPCETGNRRRL